MCEPLAALDGRVPQRGALVATERNVSRAAINAKEPGYGGLLSEVVHRFAHPDRKLRA